jgi:7,8-dihydro-6-hydroxymethylpterin-pyrophosphokinase
MPNKTETSVEPCSQEAVSSSAPKSVYLGLGSNLGDRAANLREAIERIKALGLDVVCASSIYETEPVGYKEQSWFLNQVIEVRVRLDLAFGGDLMMDDWIKAAAGGDLSGYASMFWLLEFHKALQRIEREMGRERTIVNGPRVIDIDVLIAGEQQGFWAETRGDNVRVATPPLLVLPHPRMHERRFVLEPLCEIAPDILHPTLKKTCRELLAEVDDDSLVRVYEQEKRDY